MSGPNQHILQTFRVGRKPDVARWGDLNKSIIPMTLNLVHEQTARPKTHLGIVTHFVLWFCDEIALSSSSKAPDFFNFFTKLFTAFSHHLSSASVPFFHPNNRFTTGGVNDGSIPLITIKFTQVKKIHAHVYHQFALTKLAKNFTKIIALPLPYCSLTGGDDCPIHEISAARFYIIYLLSPHFKTWKKGCTCVLITIFAHALHKHIFSHSGGGKAGAHGAVFTKTFFNKNIYGMSL